MELLGDWLTNSFSNVNLINKDTVKWKSQVFISSVALAGWTRSSIYIASELPEKSRGPDSGQKQKSIFRYKTRNFNGVDFHFHFVIYFYKPEYFHQGFLITIWPHLSKCIQSLLFIKHFLYELTSLWSQWTFSAFPLIKMFIWVPTWRSQIPVWTEESRMDPEPQKITSWGHQI